MSGCKVKGIDEALKYIESLEISEQLENKALNAGGKIFKENMIKNTPELTGAMRNSWKGSIKRADGGKAYSLYSNQWDIIFADGGSSKNKRYVGFSDRAIEEAMDEAVQAFINVIEEVF